VPAEFTLVDLVLPYVLQGDTLGSWHSVFNVLQIAEHETACDENGIVIRGAVRPDGSLAFLSRNMQPGVNRANQPATRNEPREPILEISSSTIDFELIVPRVRSEKLANADDALDEPARRVVSISDECY
jgi:hypothetical protein